MNTLFDFPFFRTRLDKEILNEIKPTFEFECWMFNRVGHDVSPEDFEWNNSEIDGRLAEYLATCKNCEHVLGIKFDPHFKNYFIIEKIKDNYYMGCPHITLNDDGPLVPLAKELLISNGIACSNYKILL